MNLKKREYKRFPWSVHSASALLATAAIAGGLINSSPLRGEGIRKTLREIDVLGGEVGGHPAGRMMQNYLYRYVEEYSQKHRNRMLERSGQGAMREWQDEMRQWYKEALGGLPDRDTPLNVRVTGEVKGEGFRMEKVLFESQPGFHVTAALFLPDEGSFNPPYPAVAVACGHTRWGKASYYQNVTIMLARHGVASLLFDPIDQGERHQVLDADGNPRVWGTNAHNRLGIGSIYLGESMARFMVHDTIRSLDFLASRKDIDGDRLGLAGQSGGGTQTGLVMGIDDRIRAAVPSGWITSWRRHVYLGGDPANDDRGPNARIGDAEQLIAGQIAAGLDYWGYLSMRAPDTATLVQAATEDFFPLAGVHETMEVAEHVYKQFGASDSMALAVVDGEHSWHRPLRERAVEWMVQHLRDEEVEVNEPDDLDEHILDRNAMQVTPTGEVLNLPGARSAYQINEQRVQSLRAARQDLREKHDADTMRGKIRELTGIRELKELGETGTHEAGKGERDGYSFETFVLVPEPGIALPLVFVEPKDSDTPAEVVLWMHEEGMRSQSSVDRIMDYLQSGNCVLAVDLRGIGETRSDALQWYSSYFAREGQSAAVAYLLGKPYVSMRAEDVMHAARFARSKSNAGGRLKLAAEGIHVALPALHAAALEPELFGELDLVGVPDSFEPLVTEPMGDLMRAYPMDHAVNGMLEVYDMQELRRLAGAE